MKINWHKACDRIVKTSHTVDLHAFHYHIDDPAYRHTHYSPLRCVHFADATINDALYTSITVFSNYYYRYLYLCSYRKFIDIKFIFIYTNIIKMAFLEDIGYASLNLLLRRRSSQWRSAALFSSKFEFSICLYPVSENCY